MKSAFKRSRAFKVPCMSRRKKRPLLADSETSWTLVAGCSPAVLEHAVTSKLLRPPAHTSANTMVFADVCASAQRKLVVTSANNSLVKGHEGTVISVSRSIEAYLKPQLLYHCCFSVLSPQFFIYFIIYVIYVSVPLPFSSFSSLIQERISRRLLSSPHYEPGPVKREMFLLEGIFILFWRKYS